MYTITASSPTGAAGLDTINLLISDRIVGGAPCHVIYFPATNIMNLVNDTGNGFVSPTGVTPGTFGFLGNGRCQVNTSAASVSSVGTNVSVTVPLSFSTLTFSGSKGVWGNAFDRGVNQLTSHWVQGGTLMVQ